MKRIITLPEIAEFFGIEEVKLVSSIHLDANKDTLQFEVVMFVVDDSPAMQARHPGKVIRLTDRRGQFVKDTCRIAVVDGE